MATRRSARERQPSKKYTVDAFEGLDLTGDLESDAQSPIVVEDDDQHADQDADFKADPSPDRMDDDELMDDEVELELLEEDSNAGQHDVGAQDAVVGSDHDLPSGAARVRTQTKRKPTDPGMPVVRHKLQARGLLDPRTRGAKSAHRLFYYGPASEDQQPALQAHYKWKLEPTLPTRKADNAGFGGFHRGFYRTDDMKAKEMKQDWVWYDEDGGTEAFQARQRVEVLNADEGASYLPNNSCNVNILMGPYKEQTLLRLHFMGSLDLDEPWIPSDDRERTLQSVRHGWLLNVGGKVQCLDWVPNTQGSFQFLAVSTISLEGHLEYPPFKSPTAPAFTPQPPYKSAIQIWAFRAGQGNFIDTGEPPELRQVICTGWGDVKSLKWCVAPRKDGKDDGSREPLRLGLLAAVCGDGALRVLDVSIPAQGHATEYLRYTNAAFTSRPPETLVTCVSWLSATGIAAGCANGSLAVWNLASALKDSNPNAEPVLFSATQSSYILALVSCYPSRPNILVTSSVDGHLTLTDLADISAGTASPAGSTIRSPRSRIAKTVMVWHDWSQIVYVVDDNYTLAAYPLRRFYSQSGVTRYKAPASSLAVSPVHPFVVAGLMNGDAVCNNPIRRSYDSKSPIWNQTWFSHEWRRVARDDPKSAVITHGDDGMGEQGDSGPETRASHGLVRMLEGFKAEQIKLLNAEDAMHNRDQGSAYSTVYELESAVTQVCWNPNIHVGGWVAAGMATGLLRVEDIAA